MYKLFNEYMDHPGVILIDIGQEGNAEKAAEKICLRIHVSAEWAKKVAHPETHFPREYEGFPVKIVVADYELQ